MTAPTPRLRFAPSPTGFLHVGGARTALFNWLYARKTDGTFLLRIEDTDKTRSSDAHVDVILDGLAWLGLDYDEDVLLQSAGVERHRALAHQLLKDEKAYEDEGAIRFRMPDTEIAWDDAIKDRITFKGHDLEDWIILRSDGSPTYNFVVVCDDIEMQITHVMRGDDHISNTPKQIAIYHALGAPLPTFAHVPNIHGPDGKKLSKRHGATAVGDYRRQGILPGAMRNFLALLGWNPGDERELFWTSQELIHAFSIERIQKKPALFDLTKLEWMNGQYLSRTPPTELLELVRHEMHERHGIDVARLEPQRLLRAIEVCAERARTTIDLAYRVAVRYDASKIERDEKATKLIEKDPEGFERALAKAARMLEQVDANDWTPENLEAKLKALAEEMGVGLGKVMQPIRMALTGQTVSEGVHLLLEVVGKEESLARLKKAMDGTARP